MKNSVYFYLFLTILVINACQSPESQQALVNEPQEENPAIPGFNAEGSDPKAIELADAVMKAMGGRENWDQTRYTTWKFFGNRKHTWDRYTGDVKIEYTQDTVSERVVLLNVNTMEGKVQHNGEAFSDADSVAVLLQQAKGQWINDSYWVFMPFKMKDSGVTLKYVGTDSTLAGVPCEVVSMTFSEVGNTPDNKYLVYIHPESHDVLQWDYYPTATDESPRFVSSWDAYKTYGNIRLSSDRVFNGEAMRKLEELAVLDSLSEGFFKEF